MPIRSFIAVGLYGELLAILTGFVDYFGMLAGFQEAQGDYLACAGKPALGVHISYECEPQVSRIGHCQNASLHSGDLPHRIAIAHNGELPRQ
jgi:hypothetical protein